ncbi:MAG: DNA protecting protein DprA [Chloroflexi bacterium UTCFX4]|jgi:DNA processing protein|nr:MAG: DNA protecting protein DprA [Chloroflexi bacterium UTCFX4]
MSKAHWLALASLSGLGGATAKKLLEQFGDVESIFDATDEQLLEIPRVTETMVENLRALRPEKFEEEIYALAEDEIDLLTWDDARFPKQLRELKDAPVILFARGAIKKGDENAVAIVGTRAASEGAIEIATTLARELALRGLRVVSGLAMGIDTAAHVGALDAEDGRTIAVLGSGIRVIHPRENAELAARIASHGALISELMPNAPPRGPQLMARDRLVSGLSRAVIVVEAGQKSGSMDTAERARKQGRLVYAIPGSEGTEGLLKGGARRLEMDAVDFDALAEEIYAHDTEKEKDAAPPQQGTLF